MSKYQYEYEIEYQCAYQHKCKIWKSIWISTWYQYENQYEHLCNVNDKMKRWADTETTTWSSKWNSIHFKVSSAIDRIIPVSKSNSPTNVVKASSLRQRLLSVSVSFRCDSGMLWHRMQTYLVVRSLVPAWDPVLHPYEVNHLSS